MTYRAWITRPLDRAAVQRLNGAIAEDRAARREEQAAAEWTEAERRAAYAAEQKAASLLAGVLAARGITDPDRALELLAGEEPLSDPFLLKDMDKACARILRAADEGETIVVYGDYDVDGVTATALLYEHLRGMGANVKCMLPSREGDGYGLSKNAIQSVYDKGYRLIVTVDNGISAVEEADFAASLGIDLVVTDHHLPPETLPKAVAIVDPRREDDESPFKGLCGAGVAFKLCAALDECDPMEMLEYCGDLAAIGTVADVMPLTGENRTLVKAGLRLLGQTERPGLGALLDQAGLAGKPVTSENVSYALAPRINAAGRMDSAVTALQLVLCEDEARAEELAHKLGEINAARQETEQQIALSAQAQLEADPTVMADRVILVWGRDWHQGVIGIVASRLVEKLGRPVIVVSVDEHGDGKGSGRSVQGFNLHAAIGSCADLLVRFGGHAMAAGLSVREENLPELRRRLNEWAARECPVVRTPPLECDLSIHLDRISVDSVRGLEQLAPFGADNPVPVFLLENAVLEAAYPVSEGKHSRVRLRQGNAAVYAIWFGMPTAQLAYGAGAAVDVALQLSVYDGGRGAQLSGRIVEMHPAGFGPQQAAQATLAEALRRGTPLAEEEKAQIRPTRADLIAVYRELQQHAWHAEDLQPLLAKMGAENAGKTLVAITALEQVGLVQTVERDGARYLAVVPTHEKRNIADAPILRCLEDTQTPSGEGGDE
jgi:single-stranded-DNA-specific exonuclease